MPLRKEIVMAEQMVIRVHPDLIKAADRAADALNLNRNEFWARVMADHLDKPDLSRIPRKKLGRPRKLQPA